MAAGARGQSFLAVVFLIGVIVAAVGVTLAFLASSAVNNIYSYEASVRAESVAVSGVQDALLQLDRNAAFSSVSPGYSVAVGSSTATVTVTPSSTDTGVTTILSTATVQGSTRKVQVVVAANATTSAVGIISWGDVQ